jgi:signal peptidase I
MVDHSAWRRSVAVDGASRLTRGMFTAALIALRRRFVAVRVEGASMEPALRAGQLVLVRRVTLAAVRHGQIVVPAFPVGVADLLPESGRPKWLIKRVLALPGDPVPHAAIPALQDVDDERIPAQRFVVVGDNRALSLDSRRLGYVHAEALLGVVTRTLRT